MEHSQISRLAGCTLPYKMRNISNKNIARIFQFGRLERLLCSYVSIINMVLHEDDLLKIRWNVRPKYRFVV